MSELLLPVGNIEMLHAAISNGADAVYIGAPHFNARGRTVDHSIPEIKAMIELAHLYNVKVHLALNILIFENELTDVYLTLEQLIPLNVDAFIVQDLGIIKMIKEMCPEQVIHGSTQMTVTNQDAIKLLDDLDIERFVLGRENSIDEMKIIKDNTEKELEVFVHGALCVSYSGQCFTSESMGGRSANRGQCAQSCRMDYKMLVDGKAYQSINEKYFVSPKDLCGIDEIPRLLDLGIDSFKIEGRLKGPSYVAAAGKNYRLAIDKKNNSIVKDEMSLTYSRGFFKGWLDGVNHQELVDGTYNEHRGVMIGKLINFTQGSHKNIQIKTSRELFLGDGILFVTSDGKEIGSKIFRITQSKDLITVDLAANIKLDNKFKQADVFWNSSDRIKKDLEISYSNLKRLKTITKKIEISFNELLPIKIKSDLFTNEFDLDLQIAKNNPCSAKGLIEELTSTGHTPFDLKINIDNFPNNLFIHNKKIKELKNFILNKLIEKKIDRPVKTLRPISSKQQLIKTETHNKSLNLLLRNIEQVDAVLSMELSFTDLENIGVIYLDFEFGQDYAKAIAKLKDKSFTVGIATTRILKPNEYYNLKNIERIKPDVILVRNLGALHFFKDKGFRLKGDFSLNVANSITANYLLTKQLETITPSYDLNLSQLEMMAKNIDPNNLEIVIHQYMPEFHMEHCVFAAFLSNGKSFKDCGKPCEKHKVELIDMYGKPHFLKPDHECRNTMYSGTAQSSATLILDSQTIKANQFRLEALNETGIELSQKVRTFLDLFTHKISKNDFLNKIGTVEKYGVTEGQLSMTDSYRDRKQQL